MNGHAEICCVIQARMGSSRLPGKVLREFRNGTCLLDHTIESLWASNRLHTIVIATSESSLDDPIYSYAKERGLSVFRGSEKNVLERYVDAAEHFGFDSCLRVCADNPFISPTLTRCLIDRFAQERADYAGYVMADRTPAICRPSGLFAECVSTNALTTLLRRDPPLEIAEHVTLGIYQDQSFDLLWLDAPAWSQYDWLRLTCDTESDFERLQHISQLMNDLDAHEAMLSKLANDESLIEEMRQENLRNAKPAIKV